MASLLISGCAGFQEWLARPETVEGAQRVAENTPRVLVNPGDIPAWIEIVSGLALVLGLGGGAVYGVRKLRAKNGVQS